MQGPANRLHNKWFAITHRWCGLRHPTVIDVHLLEPVSPLRSGQLNAVELDVCGAHEAEPNVRLLAVATCLLPESPGVVPGITTPLELLLAVALGR